MSNEPTDYVSQIINSVGAILLSVVMIAFWLAPIVILAFLISFFLKSCN
jgi:hypothetical protein